jgi:mannose-6-phosphate isomerase
LTSAKIMLYPLTFHPIFKERIWGGRNLERLYGKKLPPGKIIGESWEISDRPEGVSAIANGPLAGKDLRWLMDHYARELLGEAQSSHGRFPLLVKILDAQEKLSLQVHPPAGIANRLGGEPKTEMWYIAEATADAELFVGLKRGTTKPAFAARIQNGTVAKSFHRLPVRAGDAMFLPSGRVHAIGAGNVIFEIQQNSDTTYRVFDWNRVDASGQPRELHIEQSLESIDFEDFEPKLVPSAEIADPCGSRELVANTLFEVREHRLDGGRSLETSRNRLSILAILSGTLMTDVLGEPLLLHAGDFAMVPASIAPVTLNAKGSVRFLEALPC